MTGAYIVHSSSFLAQSKSKEGTDGPEKCHGMGAENGYNVVMSIFFSHLIKESASADDTL